MVEIPELGRPPSPSLEVFQEMTGTWERAQREGFKFQPVFFPKHKIRQIGDPYLEMEPEYWEDVHDSLNVVDPDSSQIDPADLGGYHALVEIMHPDDPNDSLAPVIAGLREEGKLKVVDGVPAGSRLGVSRTGLDTVLRPVLAERLGIDSRSRIIPTLAQTLFVRKFYFPRWKLTEGTQRELVADQGED